MKMSTDRFDSVCNSNQDPQAGHPTASPRSLRTSLAIASVISASMLAGCDEQEYPVPNETGSTSLQSLKLHSSSPALVQSLELEALALQETLQREGVIRFSPGLMSVHAECFARPSSQALAQHWRASGAETISADYEVLVLQSYLLAFGKLGDNSSSQLDGKYGEATRLGIEWLQSSFGENTEAKGYYGVEFSCRTLAQAIVLAQRQALFVNQTGASESAAKIEFANHEFGTRLLGGTDVIDGEPHQVFGLINFAYLIIERSEFPDRITPNHQSSIAAALQDAHWYLGSFGAVPKSLAVDGIWGRQYSGAANQLFEQTLWEQGEPAPDYVVGAQTARKLWSQVMTKALSQQE